MKVLEKNGQVIEGNFEEKEVKKVYISRLVKILKISKKEAEKICNTILNDIQNS